MVASVTVSRIIPSSGRIFSLQMSMCGPWKPSAFSRPHADVGRARQLESRLLCPGLYPRPHRPRAQSAPRSFPRPVPCLPQVFIESLGFEATFMLLGARQIWVQILSPLHRCVVLGRWPDLSYLILLSFLVPRLEDLQPQVNVAPFVEDMLTPCGQEV